VASEAQAEHLLLETEARGLRLATPRGEPTWKRGQRESVINLTFLSNTIYEKVSFCGTEDRRYALKKLDTRGFLQDIKNLKWTTAPEPLEALQKGIAYALEIHCPHARPSPQARRTWSSRAAQLLAGVRQARRRYHDHGENHDRQSYKALSNQLQKEIRRVGRNNWRRFVQEFTADPTKPYNKGLWTLSRWSRKSANATKGDPHLPDLRSSTSDPLTKDNTAK
ncbi:hypothetical protein K469DRAFT_746285, partial [Zopfia rhizophila CBS 207.26]